jgi:hypothetical protein
MKILYYGPISFDSFHVSDSLDLGCNLVRFPHDIGLRTTARRDGSSMIELCLR